MKKREPNRDSSQQAGERGIKALLTPPIVAAVASSIVVIIGAIYVGYATHVRGARLKDLEGKAEEWAIKYHCLQQDLMAEQQKNLDLKIEIPTFLALLQSGQMKDLQEQIMQIKEIIAQRKNGQLREADIIQLTEKIQGQAEKISEVKKELKSAENYIASGSAESNNLRGEIVYNDGRTVEFNWMGSDFLPMNQWWADYICYSTDIEAPGRGQTIKFKDISRIDFLEITEQEREKDPKSNWPMKARILFKDGTSWDQVYLSVYSWKFKTEKAIYPAENTERPRYDGMGQLVVHDPHVSWIICRVAMWPQRDDYRSIKSIIFQNK